MVTRAVRQWIPEQWSSFPCARLLAILITILCWLGDAASSGGFRLGQSQTRRIPHKEAVFPSSGYSAW